MYLQVQSRVQKYFIKLAKAGLPIPGRRPNINSYGIKKVSIHVEFWNLFLVLICYIPANSVMFWSLRGI